ncbi:hypothetical protein AGMMS49545_14900 [Betaproteobacteria bacterium]|nr:hypothetical protein AGMMS49545_14900 [Betaproteobacteria bacterium]GHU45339.1 hypothetical protein AGMMS50289_16340 [Betaproteobacteria bacterium]
MFSEPLLCLIIWHFIADIPLQPPVLADGKRKPGLAGIAMLGTHGLIHGIGTGLILGSVWVALAETLVHALVDWGKCRKYYGLIPDQCAHLSFLVLWFFIFQTSAM